MDGTNQEILKLIRKISFKDREIEEHKAHRDKLIYTKVKRSWNWVINQEEDSLANMLDELELALQPRRLAQSKNPGVNFISWKRNDVAQSVKFEAPEKRPESKIPRIQ